MMIVVVNIIIVNIIMILTMIVTIMNIMMRKAGCVVARNALAGCL